MNTLIKEGVDLIVLDVGLPDINGFELCKDIRKKDQYSYHLPYCKDRRSGQDSWA